jgi:hypothetical protein
MNLFNDPVIEQYKVLTLWQPWATLLVNGVKKNETRPKASSWRGTYLIHAAKQMHGLDKDLCQKEPFKSELAKLGINDWRQLPTGCIIGAFNVAYCAPCLHGAIVFRNNYVRMPQYQVDEPLDFAFGDFSHGRFAWVGENHRQLATPIKYTNGQGYYLPFKGDASQIVFK